MNGLTDNQKRRYHFLREEIQQLVQLRTSQKEALRITTEELERLISEKWSLESLMTPVKVLPYRLAKRKVFRPKSQPKSRPEKLHPLIEAELKKMRGEA